MESRAEKLKSLQEDLRSVLHDPNVLINMNEETTKTAFILNLLNILGYNIYNRHEVAMEVPVDSGRIDIMLKVNDKDLVIIECKALSEKLNDKSIKQLKRYYTDKKAHLAILTNGNDYWFFTDSERMNVMSKNAFMTIRITDIEDNYAVFDRYDREHIESAYIPNIGDKLIEEKANLKKQLKIKDSELNDTLERIHKLEKYYSLTEIQQSELVKLRDTALLLQKENAKLKSKIDYANEYDTQSKNYKTKKLHLKIDYGNKFDKFIVKDEIAEDMIGLLPDEIFNSKTTFFDPCCRHGEFLLAIMNRLMNSKSMIDEFPNKGKRLDYIRYHQLFALMPDVNGLEEVTRAVYGTAYPSNSHIIGFQTLDEADDKYINYMCALYILKLNKQNKLGSLLIGEVEADIIEKLGDILDMKFDVVVSNPPYNKGQDLDFVALANSIANKYSIFIAPAKWQTASKDHRVTSKIDYETFRNRYVQYISNIVFYPCCKDVFDIYQPDGIAYYMINKDKQDKCVVENKCDDIKWFNSVEIRDIRNRKSLLNIGNEIIEYLGDYTCFKFPEVHGNDKYEVWTNTQPSGYDWYVTTKPRYLLCPSRVVRKCDGEHCDVESSKLVFESNSIEECNSFVSWLNCKFTRFFLMPNISRLTGIMNDDCFRFVPAPPSGKFDHIYTDAELYKEFNIPKKYIDIIESVIKERK